jgi:hypothetical protein
VVRPNRVQGESGIALIAVILGLVLLSVIGAGLAAVGTVEYRAAVNHRSATQALMLADAGAAHALALLRGPLEDRDYTELLVGPDGVANTADDGVLAGQLELADSIALVPDGIRLDRGLYYVRLANDPEDPSGSPYRDSNHRLVAECRGETDDQGTADLRVVIASHTYPAIATNGDLHVPGSVEVVGDCAGVHANRELRIGGSPVVDGRVSASDTVLLTGTVHDAEGNVVEPGYQAPIEIPPLDPFQFCDEADYLLAGGNVMSVGASGENTSVPAGGPGALGWKWDAGKETYSLDAKAAVPGTVCVSGNVEVNGNLGDPGSPLSITIAATGSVKLGGTPVVRADHSENVLIVSGGDVQIAGNASGATTNYQGTIYAHGQCQVNGNPLIDGQILCYDAPDRPGNLDIVDGNKINGTARFRYDCSGLRRKAQIDAWWEVRTP